MKTFSTFDPYLQKKLKTYKLLSDSQMAGKAQLSQQAQGRWRQLSFEQRLQCLLEVKLHLQKQLKNLSLQATREMGKRLSESEAELKKVLQIFDFLSDEKTLLYTQPKEVQTTTQKVEIYYRPMGTLLIVMPWNFPYWQVYRMALPNLLMGNSILLKHSEITAGCADLIEKSFKQSLPKEFKFIFQNLFISHEQVDRLIQNPLVKGVSLTGSERAGKSIGARAGAEIKKSVLELGGSDPYLILADADLQLAAKQCAQSRLINNGQSCVAAKRFIVEAPVYNKFLELFFNEFESTHLGDPKLLQTGLGPLAHPRFVKDLEVRIKLHNKKKNWQLIYQKESEFSSSEGFFAPQVYAVKNAQAFQHEEFFAPLALVYRAKNIKDMISQANSTAFGLGAAVFTQDRNLYETTLAPQIESGLIFHNQMVKSDVYAPFGGVKNSGFGRELGLLGLTEFCSPQVVA